MEKEIVLKENSCKCTNNYDTLLAEKERLMNSFSEEFWLKNNFEYNKQLSTFLQSSSLKTDILSKKATCSNAHDELGINEFYSAYLAENRENFTHFHTELMKKKREIFKIHFKNCIFKAKNAIVMIFK